MNTDNTIYNVTFGVTGRGKSHLVNLLSAPGQPPVLEDSTFSAVTNQITERKMYNGEIITDTIGFLNDPSESIKMDDQEILKEFIGYMKNKHIRTIFYFCAATCRVDRLDHDVLNSLKLSGLQDHIIIVYNCCVKQGNYVDNYNGIRSITFETDQRDLKMLKNMINDTPTKRLSNMPVPPILFKDPIVIRAKTEVREFLREETIPMMEFLSNEVRIPYSVEVTRSTNIFVLILDFLFGIGNTTTEIHYRTETTTQGVTVQRTHRVFQVYEVELAERFDGALDIYKKSPIAIDFQRIG